MFVLDAGQTVCVGGARQPCYKMAYFHDVSSRVAFKEAGRICRMDGGSLLSIESSEEQTDIENLLQVRNIGPSSSPAPPPHLSSLRDQELRSGAVGGAGPEAGGIVDGDFWIGLTRVDEDGRSASELSNGFTSCPQRYRWTDGSPASFR